MRSYDSLPSVSTNFTKGNSDALRIIVSLVLYKWRKEFINNSFNSLSTRTDYLNHNFQPTGAERCISSQR